MLPSQAGAPCFALPHPKQEDELAWELLSSISISEPSLQATLELTQLISLLEAPAFASLRMRLLAPADHPHLLRAVAGLLMLLPQGEAFRTLQARLQVVPPMQLALPAAPSISSTSQPSQRCHRVAQYLSTFQQRRAF